MLAHFLTWTTALAERMMVRVGLCAEMSPKKHADQQSEAGKLEIRQRADQLWQDIEDSIVDWKFAALLTN
jgi:hypothetical protein